MGYQKPSQRTLVNQINLLKINAFNFKKTMFFLIFAFLFNTEMKKSFPHKPYKFYL